MKRRNFTQSFITTLAVSSLPIGLSLATKSAEIDWQNKEKIKSKEGMIFKLNKQVNPTKNKDHKQFILTYDVKNHTTPLVERIYDLELANGNYHQVFMTPVAKNQLQAVFNWRLNA